MNRLERSAALSGIRAAGTRFANQIRRGLYPGWVEVDGRGQCGRCRMGVPSPSWQQGTRLFRRATWRPKPAGAGGYVVRTDNLCVVCAFREIRA